MILICGAEGPLLEEARAVGVSAEVHELPSEFLVLESAAHSGPALALRLLRGSISARRYAAMLTERIAALNVNLVHTNGLKFHILSALLKISVPVVWHIRDFCAGRRLARAALRWASKSAALAIANSQATAADFRRAVPLLRVRTVLNGIDTEYFKPGIGDGQELDRLGELPPARKGEAILRIGILGSYARWKGQDIFLNAAAMANLESARYFVIGGPLLPESRTQFTVEELRTLARELGIAGQTGFIPFRTDPVSLYRSLDIVVHASTEPEPFGRVIAEAMACGKPVIAALAGGVPELIRSEVDAIGILPNDPGVLAEAMRRLAEDSALRQRLGTAARASAIERFSLERIGSELLECYDSVLR